MTFCVQASVQACVQARAQACVQALLDLAIQNLECLFKARDLLLAAGYTVLIADTGINARWLEHPPVPSPMPEMFLAFWQTE